MSVLLRLLFAVGFISFLGCGRLNNENTTSQIVNDAGTGGWVSSGGDLFEYSKNPWFVENTVSVQYCVSIDPSSFSASSEQVNVAIERSLRYWKTDFDEHNRKLAPSAEHGSSLGMFRLGTQEYQRISTCNGLEDIQLVFGSGALSQKQKAFLKDPRRHVGTAVRTSYDRVNLRGKGFIFVGSDQGPDSVFAPEMEATGKWANPSFLSSILTHELGHVFGLPHFGSGLMAEGFPNTLVSSLVGFTTLKLQCQSTFVPPRLSVGLLMKLRRDHYDWWGVSAKKEDALDGWAIALKQVHGSWKDLQLPGKSIEFQVTGFSMKNLKVQRSLGKILVESVDHSKSAHQFQSEVLQSILHLPEEQKVYDSSQLLSGKTIRQVLQNIRDPELRKSYEIALEAQLDTVMPHLPLLYGMTQLYVGLPAVFVTEAGERKPIFLQGSPGAYILVAQVEGRMVPVLTTGGPEIGILDGSSLSPSCGL